MTTMTMTTMTTPDLNLFQRAEQALMRDLNARRAADAIGIGHGTVAMVKTILDRSPDAVIAACRQGTMTITRAYKPYRSASKSAVEAPHTPTAVDTPQATPPARKRSSGPVPRRGPHDYMKAIRAEVTARNVHVQGRALTLEEFADRWHVHTDIARRYIREAALLGLVTEENRRFTIAALPEREELRIWRDRLRAEITRRRNANNDRRGSTRWDPVQINLAEHRGIIDFIESQLDIAPL